MHGCCLCSVYILFHLFTGHPGRCLKIEHVWILLEFMLSLELQLFRQDEQQSLMSTQHKLNIEKRHRWKVARFSAYKYNITINVIFVKLLIFA